MLPGIDNNPPIFPIFLLMLAVVAQLVFCFPALLGGIFFALQVSHLPVGLHGFPQGGVPQIPEGLPHVLRQTVHQPGLVGQLGALAEGCLDPLIPVLHPAPQPLHVARGLLCVVMQGLAVQQHPLAGVGRHLVQGLLPGDALGAPPHLVVDQPLQGQLPVGGVAGNLIQQKAPQGFVGLWGVVLEEVGQLVARRGQDAGAQIAGEVSPGVDVQVDFAVQVGAVLPPEGPITVRVAGKPHQVHPNGPEDVVGHFKLFLLSFGQLDALDGLGVHLGLGFLAGLLPGLVNPGLPGLGVRRVGALAHLVELGHGLPVQGGAPHGLQHGDPAHPALIVGHGGIHDPAVPVRFGLRAGGLVELEDGVGVLPQPKLRQTLDGVHRVGVGLQVLVQVLVDCNRLPVGKADSLAVLGEILNLHLLPGAVLGGDGGLHGHAAPAGVPQLLVEFGHLGAAALFVGGLGAGLAVSLGNGAPHLPVIGLLQGLGHGPPDLVRAHVLGGASDVLLDGGIGSGENAFPIALLQLVPKGLLLLDALALHLLVHVLLDPFHIGARLPLPHPLLPAFLPALLLRAFPLRGRCLALRGG